MDLGAVPSLFFMPEMSLDLLHSVGIPNPLQWPTLITASLLDIGFAFYASAAFALALQYGCCN